MMKIAVYQAPLHSMTSMDAMNQIGRQIERCEDEGVSILCCPEAILGGLADNAESPSDIALTLSELTALLTPIADNDVALIIGFTESGDSGKFYNSAAVIHCGKITGVYRKIHPFINRSVYTAGDKATVFTIGGLTFGIVICYDSTFPALSSEMASRGAGVIFIPTNNTLPLGKADVVNDVRRTDTSIAVKNSLWVARSDVAGEARGMISYGSSAIVDPTGRVRVSAAHLTETLLIQDIDR